MKLRLRRKRTDIFFPFHSRESLPNFGLNIVSRRIFGGQAKDASTDETHDHLFSWATVTAIAERIWAERKTFASPIFRAGSL
jgi:hypothetical protein